jgi:hypothetical protein
VRDAVCGYPGRGWTGFSGGKNKYRMPGIIMRPSGLIARRVPFVPIGEQGRVPRNESIELVDLRIRSIPTPGTIVSLKLHESLTRPLDLGQDPFLSKRFRPTRTNSDRQFLSRQPLSTNSRLSARPPLKSLQRFRHAPLRLSLTIPRAASRRIACHQAPAPLILST